MSLDDVVEAAAKVGYSFTKSRLHQLETAAEFPTWPSAQIVKGLAKALVIPEPVLSLALLESMGLRLPQMPSSEWMLLVAKGESLSPPEQRRLRKTIGTMFPDDREDDEP